MKIHSLTPRKVSLPSVAIDLVRNEFNIAQITEALNPRETSKPGFVTKPSKSDSKSRVEDQHLGQELCAEKPPGDVHISVPGATRMTGCLQYLFCVADEKRKGHKGVDNGSPTPPERPSHPLGDPLLLAT